MYIYVYLQVYLCIYLYVYLYIQIYIFKFICIFIFIFKFTSWFSTTSLDFCYIKWRDINSAPRWSSKWSVIGYSPARLLCSGERLQGSRRYVRRQKFGGWRSRLGLKEFGVCEMSVIDLFFHNQQ